MSQVESTPCFQDDDDSLTAIRHELLEEARITAESQLAAAAVMLTMLERLPNASQRQKAELEQSNDRFSTSLRNEDSLLMATRTMENADNLNLWLEDIVLEGIEHGAYTPDEVDALYDRLQLLDDALKNDLSVVLDKIDDAIIEFFDTLDEDSPPIMAIAPPPPVIATPTPKPPMVTPIPRPQLHAVWPETPEELYTPPPRDPALQALINEISGSKKSHKKVTSINHRTPDSRKRRR